MVCYYPCIWVRSCNQVSILEFYIISGPNSRKHKYIFAITITIFLSTSKFIYPVVIGTIVRTIRRVGYFLFHTLGIVRSFYGIIIFSTLNFKSNNLVIKVLKTFNLWIKLNFFPLLIIIACSTEKGSINIIQSIFSCTTFRWSKKVLNLNFSYISTSISCELYIIF